MPDIYMMHSYHTVLYHLWENLTDYRMLWLHWLIHISSREGGSAANFFVSQLSSNFLHDSQSPSCARYPSCHDFSALWSIVMRSVHHISLLSTMLALSIHHFETECNSIAFLSHSRYILSQLGHWDSWSFSNISFLNSRLLSEARCIPLFETNWND